MTERRGKEDGGRELDQSASSTSLISFLISEVRTYSVISLELDQLVRRSLKGVVEEDESSGEVEAEGNKNGGGEKVSSTRIESSFQG